MNHEELRELIADYNPEAILFDDLDDAIIGVGQQHGMHTVAIYDSEKCIEIFKRKFMESDPDLIEEEAETQAIEWFEYNVLTAYVGTSTPIFLNRLEDYE